MLGWPTGIAALAVLMNSAVGGGAVGGPELSSQRMPIVLVAQAGAPCTVITDADVAQALDDAGRRDTNPQSQLADTCAWRSESVAGDALTVAVDPGGQSKFDLDRKQISGSPLDGVGDAAFAFVSLANFVQLGMMTHGIYVTIVLQLQRDSQRLERAEQLARVIASRL